MIGSRLGVSAHLGGVKPLAILVACSVYGTDRHIAHMVTCRDQAVRIGGLCVAVSSFYSCKCCVQAGECFTFQPHKP